MFIDAETSFDSTLTMRKNNDATDPPKTDVLLVFVEKLAKKQINSISRFIECGKCFCVLNILNQWIHNAADLHHRPHEQLTTLVWIIFQQKPETLYLIFFFSWQGSIPNNSILNWASFLQFLEKCFEKLHAFLLEDFFFLVYIPLKGSFKDVPSLTWLRTWLDYLQYVLL